jgi:hypothetical protein
MLEKVKEATRPNLPKKLVEGSLEFAWANKFIRLDDSNSSVMLPVNVKYRKEKSNGEPHKNFNSDSINIAMTYCPFCGAKFNEGAA